MRNLLPAAYRKKVTIEYRLRVAVVVFSLILIIAVVGIALLTPSYFLSRSKRDSASEQKAFIERSIEFRESEISAELLRKTRDRLVLLADDGNRMSFTEIIEKLIRDKGIGVAISGISHVRLGGTGTLTITGEALQRDSLLAFKKALDREASFSSVSLPISDLAKSRDIEFTLTLKTE